MYAVHLSDEQKLFILLLSLLSILISLTAALCLASPWCILHQYLDERRRKQNIRSHTVPAGIVIHHGQHHRRQHAGRSMTGRSKRRDHTAIDIAPPPYEHARRYPGQASAKHASGADPSSQTWRNINLVSQLANNEMNSTQKFDSEHTDYGDYFHPPKTQNVALDYYQTLNSIGLDSQELAEGFDGKKLKSCAELLTTAAFLRPQSQIGSNIGHLADNDANLPLMIKFSIEHEMTQLTPISSDETNTTNNQAEQADASMDMSSISSTSGTTASQLPIDTDDQALERPACQNVVTHPSVTLQTDSSISSDPPSLGANDSSGSKSTYNIVEISPNESVPSVVPKPTKPSFLKLVTGDKFSSDQRCRFIIYMNTVENVKTCVSNATILSDIYVRCDILAPTKTRYLRGPKNAAKDGKVVVTFRTQSLPKIPGLTHDIVFDSTFVTPLLAASLVRNGCVRLRVYEEIKHVNDVCIGELKLPISQALKSNDTQSMGAVPSYECQLIKQPKGKICLGISYLPTSNRVIFNAYRATMIDDKEMKNLKMQAGNSYFLRFMMIVNGRMARKKRTPINSKPSWDSQESITFDLVNVSVEQPKFIVALVLRNPSLNKSLNNLASSSSSGNLGGCDRDDTLNNDTLSERLGVLSNFGTTRSWYHHKPWANGGQGESENKMNQDAAQTAYYYASEPGSPVTPEQMASGLNHRKVSSHKRDVVIGHFVIGHELWTEMRNKPRLPITREFVIY